MMLSQKSLFRDRVFVALPEEPRDGKSILSWVIDHVSDSAQIIIVHIVTSPNFESRQQILDCYLDQCSRKKVRAEKRVFLFTEIDEGLIHLINIYGVTELVIGAAADRHYRRKMKAPQSQTALSVMQKADSHCNMWFICKGKLVFFRKANYCLLTKSRSARPSCGVGNPKMDLQSLLQPNLEAKRLEYMYIKDMEIRKEIEAEISQQKEQTETLKEATLMLQNELDWYRYQWNKNANALQEANKQKHLLEHRISELDSVASYLGESMRASDSLVNSLKLEYSKVKRERDDAVKEARDMRMEKELTEPCAYGAMNSEFSLVELEQATQVFSSSLNIGQGGFGSVYKGFLRSTTVAIKILNTESLHAQSQFKQEVAILSRVRHPNLVTLIGASPEASALVYEFLPNGSLEDRLNCVNNTLPLSWQVRIQIIMEVCSALIFLHKHKPHPVVHGDLKPGNILLDANLVSKLSDFGISRLLLESSVTGSEAHFTTQPMGTPAYMDPEFFGTGELTPQSDTYSFGITILRLLTGRAPLRLTRVVQEALNDNDLHSVLDHSAGEWPLVQAEQLARIGLQCSELSRQKRPDLELNVWRVVQPMRKEAPSPLSQSFRSIFNESSRAVATPSYFLCPISQVVMRDPQVAADGFTYEADALRYWLDSGHDTSPVTNKTLSNRDTIPNHALRSAIQEYLRQNKLQELFSQG
ncbi:unnamed protein product [Miscanthus lutarioriparius]|uniref:RING-type E3 ubiquitin transferase n=1 Tax=Miscanthus lutarioriparius TaxID=422564 RepID=A0A811MM35_9POAL|nr:unnamed protein product [Miscanthus lutarioriparius]